MGPVFSLAFSTSISTYTCVENWIPMPGEYVGGIWPATHSSRYIHLTVKCWSWFNGVVKLCTWEVTYYTASQPYVGRGYFDVRVLLALALALRIGTCFHAAPWLTAI